MAAPPVHTAEATKSGTMRSAQRLFDTLVSMNATNLINVEICARSTRSFAWKSMEFQTQVYCNVVKWLLCFRWILKTMPSRSRSQFTHTLRFSFPEAERNWVLIGWTDYCWPNFLSKNGNQLESAKKENRMCVQNQLWPLFGWPALLTRNHSANNKNWIDEYRVYKVFCDWKWNFNFLKLQKNATFIETIVPRETTPRRFQFHTIQILRKVCGES